MLQALFFFASIAGATFHQQGQIPLRTPSRDVVEPLTLTQDLRYIFPSSDISGHARLESLGDVTSLRGSTTSSIIVDIPLDPTLPGSVSFSSNTSDALESAVWLSSTSHIDLDHVGIRKGGMITMPVSAPAILALGMPGIAVPKEIFNVLLQAAETSPGQNYVVDCDLISRLPDLVFGVIAGGDGYGEDVEEVVVTPQQYVLETDGRCVLLARCATTGRIAMGWTAFRGRKFVLDLGHDRMGLF